MYTFIIVIFPSIHIESYNDNDNDKCCCIAGGELKCKHLQPFVLLTMKMSGKALGRGARAGSRGAIAPSAQVKGGQECPFCQIVFLKKMDQGIV